MTDWTSRFRSLLRGRRPEAAPPASDAESPEVPPAPGVEVEAPPAEPSEAPSDGPPVAEAAPVEPEPAAPGPPAPFPTREEQLEAEVRDLRDERLRLEDALARERQARARLEEEVRSLADQDPLTGLASGRRFADRLAVAVIHAQRYRQKLAVVQLGLDRFSRVNDRLGRSHGDDLLRSVALALESTLRQGDTLARISGDVFTILLPGIKRDEDVTVIADKLRLALRSPFSIGGHDLLVTASLGVALFPDDGPDTESLLQSASVALQRAKERGGDSWDVHAPRSRALAAERLAREASLRRALVQGDLELFWQPVVECETGAIVGVESLLRWRREERLERAADFVSLADVSGLAVPLGQWTLRAACAQGRRWHDAGHRGLVVSVNVSARQLSHAALVKLVRRVLEETGLPPECLELEVGEGELARGPELAIERLAELRRLGLRIALDDFGTGESRLAHLYRYPLDTLKIDGSVVKGAAASRDHEAILTAAVAFARSRRLKVVAEGVETEAQRVHLVRWQCDRMQGNLCGPPATAAETEGLLLRQRRSGGDAAAEDAGEPRRLL
jgi:diguanylate cyclase (GGDEF)-like protein